MRKLSSLILMFLLFHVLNAQEAEWDFKYNLISNTEIELIMNIQVPDSFHMYSFDQAPGGPIPAEVVFNPVSGVSAKGNIIAVTPPREYFDDVFNIQIRDFGGKAVWKQRFTIPENKEIVISGSYSYQLCMDDGMCINPFPRDFSITIPATNPSTPKTPISKTIEQVDTVSEALQIDDIQNDMADLEQSVIQENAMHQHKESTKNMTIWWIFIAGFIGGLLAFLTPCVFPMVPMTVSLFMKKSRSVGVRDALIFGFSIIVIYITLGLLITGIYGAPALNELSTSIVFNIIFFAIFLLFAISFFGAFELTLPASWVNYMDKKTDTTSGLVSVFFMAFTLVLVSFSCTAMIIGTLLVESVVTGSLLGPFVGMLGFSIALALPFTVLALFPSLLQSLPKSGGWLNSVKVVLGFIELGLALKFLSKADLVAGWGILPRDVFLAIWIVLMVLLGLYILGKIRFTHDSEVKTVSTSRFLLALASFAFALYLVPGLFGAPLSSLSGYLPPLTTQKFDLYTPLLNTSHVQPVQTIENKDTKKYAEHFDCPFNLNCFFDYEQGLAYAKKQGKPVLLDFTGKGCENCRKIEMNVWSKPEVLSLLQNEYVVISLYVDSRISLPKSEQRVEHYEGREYAIKTIGQHWSYFMMTNYHTLSQPYYVILDGNGNRLVEPIAYNEAQYSEQFVAFLKKGLERIANL
ncbi:MAG: thioredoxin family protein [Bacteroidales bacterium]|nr:thioredoxin family protein [Bacteroidales bacterium]NLK81400.1 hypothetical protein [Bacteroidales bacterium]